MKKKGARAKFSPTGFLLFFLPLTAVVSATVLVHDKLTDAPAGVTAAIMFSVIVVFSVVCTLLDMLRRTLTNERPAAQILEATDRIASGDFSVRLSPAHPFNKYDNYDKIMENLNRMAAELSKTEVLHSDFIANVSHEIKTPLAVIRSYASALRSDGIPPERRREYADVLVSASAKLSSLVTDILKLNKLENSELRPETKPTDLGENLRASVLGFEEPIERKGLRLECDIDDVTVPADGNLLTLAWNNLLSNAVKFTPEGGTITVTLKDEGTRAAVCVRDTGCGISPETGAHIFDKFYQGDTSHAQEGNWLGLALVKKVIELTGGEIAVESEPGKGSAFTVRLRKGE